MTKEQLCWTCQKAGGDCSWSSCFQPVEGWTAEKVHRKTYDSYRIEKCPEYVADDKPLKAVSQKKDACRERARRAVEFYKQGMKARDIAETLNVDVSTVYNYIRRNKN